MYGDVDMTKVMYGENAMHIPMWMVAQEGGIIAAATTSPKAMYGSDMTHVLTLGEMIIRPHFAIGSNDFAGHGAGGFWTDNPGATEWLENGRVFVDTKFGREMFMRWR